MQITMKFQQGFYTGKRIEPAFALIRCQNVRNETDAISSRAMALDIAFLYYITSVTELVICNNYPSCQFPWINRETGLVLFSVISKNLRFVSS